jgi:hypothetical protein
VIERGTGNHALDRFESQKGSDLDGASPQAYPKGAARISESSPAGRVAEQRSCRGRQDPHNDRSSKRPGQVRVTRVAQKELALGHVWGQELILDEVTGE